MKQYLLSIYQPDGGPPAPEILDPVMRALDRLNAELDAAGVVVLKDGLLPPETATVVRVQDDEVLLTDGPYLEGKEHVGGFWIIKAPDLDAALAWGAKAARALRHLPVEVRPLHTEVEG